MQSFYHSFKVTAPVLAVSLVASSFIMFGGLDRSYAAAPCEEDANVGGGVNTGTSPGPTGNPATALGWDVGTGQCNGSFTSKTFDGFPGGSLELAMRAEERRQGAVARIGANEYQVELGNDSGDVDRAWWNFQHSIAYGGNIDDLDSLTFKITTHVGPNQPSASEVDMLAFRGIIDDRQGGSTPTTGFNDLYQTSQNPEFSWFSPDFDNDVNPDGKFNYDQEGAWLMTLTAEKYGETASVSICVHTPNAQCFPDHLACHAVKDVDRLYGITVDVEDEFTTQDGLKVKKAKEMCVTADKNGEGILDDPAVFVCYDVQQPRRPYSHYGYFWKKHKSEKSEQNIVNQFTDGQHLLVEEDVHRICVPSRISN